MAFGVAGRFHDLPREQQVQTLAVLLHMQTEEGARASSLPATFASSVTFANDRAKANKKAAKPGGR